MEDEADGADGVVVAGDGVVNDGGVGVGIDDGDDGDVEAFCFCDGDGFAGGVNDDDGVGFFLKVADTAKVAEEFFALAAEGGEFLFGHGFELGLFLDVFEVAEAFDGFADGGCVGEHSAEPAVVDEVLAGGFCGFADGVLSLGFAAYEEDLFVFAGEVSEEVGGFIELLDGFLEVDDVDSAFVLHEVRLHAGVPFFSLVAVVDACVHHFSDEFVDHVFV